MTRFWTKAEVRSIRVVWLSNISMLLKVCNIILVIWTLESIHISLKNKCTGNSCKTILFYCQLNISWWSWKYKSKRNFHGKKIQKILRDVSFRGDGAPYLWSAIANFFWPPLACAKIFRKIVSPPSQDVRKILAPFPLAKKVLPRTLLDLKTYYFSCYISMTL